MFQLLKMFRVEDVFSTIQCLRKLGVRIIKKSKGNYLVYGKGLGSLYAKKYRA